LDPAPASAVVQKRDPEVVPKASRRTFTASYKLRILREADACERGQIGALLRREGLYASHLTDWRLAAAAGLEPAQRGPKAKPVDPNAAELKALRRANADLQRRLQKAELVIDIQKKVAALLGIPLQKPDFGEDF
jgi:transposase-like protein